MPPRWNLRYPESMRSLARIAPLAVLIAIIAACGGASRAGDDAYREAAAQAVRDAVLTLDDLPDGWTPSEIGPEALADLQLTGACALLNGRGAGFPGEVASRDSEPLTGPSNEELVNTVNAFNDKPAAEAAVRQADGLVLQCEAQIEEALKRAIQVAAKDIGVDDLISGVDASLEPGSFTKFGDETLAYLLPADISTFLAGGYDVNGKILLIRDGPLTGVLIYAILGDLDPQDERSLAGLLAEKLARAEESLPD
jgi:hypothetical protein